VPCFSDLGYTSVGDKYIDPSRHTRLYELEKKRKIPKDQPIFKPSDSYKTVVKAPFEHIGEKIDVNKKPKIGENNKVITEPPNIMASATVKGLSKPYEHLTDEYEREREFRVK